MNLVLLYGYHPASTQKLFQHLKAPPGLVRIIQTSCHPTIRRTKKYHSEKNKNRYLSYRKAREGREQHNHKKVGSMQLRLGSVHYRWVSIQSNWKASRRSARLKHVRIENCYESCALVFCISFFSWLKVLLDSKLCQCSINSPCPLG